MSSVEALVNQAAQTSYLARAEYPSIALSERLQSAVLEVSLLKVLTIFVTTQKKHEEDKDVDCW